MRARGPDGPAAPAGTHRQGAWVQKATAPRSQEHPTRWLMITTLTKAGAGPGGPNPPRKRRGKAKRRPKTRRRNQQVRLSQDLLRGLRVEPLSQLAALLLVQLGNSFAEPRRLWMAWIARPHVCGWHGSVFGTWAVCGWHVDGLELAVVEIQTQIQTQTRTQTQIQRTQIQSQRGTTAFAPHLQWITVSGVTRSAALPTSTLRGARAPPLGPLELKGMGTPPKGKAWNEWMSGRAIGARAPSAPRTPQATRIFVQTGLWCRTNNYRRHLACLPEFLPRLRGPLPCLV